MTAIAAAIDSGDLARFVDAVFLVYIVLVIASVAISWYVSFRGSLPYSSALRAVTGFVEETTAPYLNLFRRYLPPVGAGGMAIDLSPMIGLILLFVSRSIVVGLIEG
ncbi:MAG: YggT family protein [Acidobacteria bacterium]|nr:MAG: YggT family protein [Acidobacteriota bacterium]MCL4286836.1 YggT family protein [Thermoleophilia bacterium]GIK78112.1 MAG: hypothetical protein BroJett022_18020 [Actinomycetes bacterium]